MFGVYVCVLGVYVFGVYVFGVYVYVFALACLAGVYAQRNAPGAPRP